MPDLTTVRPCVKCGTADRYASGNCKVCSKSSGVSWAKANPEKVKSMLAVWTAANHAKKKATDLVWRTNNTEKIKTKSATWAAANREAKNISNQNRRAKKRENGGTLSRGLSAKLFKLQKGKCPCCKQPLGDNYHLDHIIPLALGGYNTDENTQLLRQRCNNQKHIKHPVDFMQERGFLL